MYTVERTPLAKNWEDRQREGYDFIIIGSGYGGAITAARLANAEWPAGKPSICVLERGREWLPGHFPDNLIDGAGALRSSLNPLGLYDFRIGTDIGAWMASGLGGTSLINANVAIEPDSEVFDNPQWPQAIRYVRDDGNLKELFARVRSKLHASPHPQGWDLSKVKALQLGTQNVDMICGWTSGGQCVLTRQDHATSVVVKVGTVWNRPETGSQLQRKQAQEVAKWQFIGGKLPLACCS